MSTMQCFLQVLSKPGSGHANHVCLKCELGETRRQNHWELAVYQDLCGSDGGALGSVALSINMCYKFLTNHKVLHIIQFH